MDWEEYKSKFYHYAKYNGKEESYINDCLNYAEKLFAKSIPIIYDLTHFSQLVGYKEEYINKVTNSQSVFYREFKIPKKTKGQFRVICEPLPNLKDIQRWILDEILNQFQPSPYSKAFRMGYSIKDNAKYHRKQKKVLSLDIKDYFGSISYEKVISLFRSFGYSKHISMILSKICTLEDTLPQGAPTSPMLSNLITKNIDNRIGKFTSKYNIRYTRYADDLTFSGDFDESLIINYVRKVLEDQGLRINENKTRVRKQNQQQEVTGIVVNEKLQASRNYRRNLRQKIHYIKRYGLDDQSSREGYNSKIIFLYHLLGSANFILSVNPNDNEALQHYEYLKDLLKKNKKSKEENDDEYED